MIEAGYAVFGFDVSASMLDLARARAPRAELQLGSFVFTALPPCVAVAAAAD